MIMDSMREQNTGSERIVKAMGKLTAWRGTSKTVRTKC